MTLRIPRFLRSPYVPFALALGLLGWIAAERPTARELRGDEATYVAMAESVARDFDLVFDARDRARIEASPASGQALILQRAGERVAYSKPILWALLAAPFALFAPLWGGVAANLVALVAGYLFLRAALVRALGPADGEWSAATLAGAGGAAAWAGWRMTESLQLGLAAAGLALACAALRPAAPEAPRGLARALARVAARAARGRRAARPARFAARAERPDRARRAGRRARGRSPPGGPRRRGGRARRLPAA